MWSKNSSTKLLTWSWLTRVSYHRHRVLLRSPSLDEVKTASMCCPNAPDMPTKRTTCAGFRFLRVAFSIPGIINVFPIAAVLLVILWNYCLSIMWKLPMLCFLCHYHKHRLLSAEQTEDDILWPLHTMEITLLIREMKTRNESDWSLYDIWVQTKHPYRFSNIDTTHYRERNFPML